MSENVDESRKKEKENRKRRGRRSIVKEKMRNCKGNKGGKEENISN